MINLSQLPDNINVTVTKNDLVELITVCLKTNHYHEAKQTPEHLNLKQLAVYLGYSVPTIYKMVSQAAIPSYKLSGKLLFKKSEIDEWLLDFKQPTLKSQINDLDDKCK